MERLRGVGLDPRLLQWADELYKENEPYRRATKGGTGQKEYTTGDLLYASDKFTLAKLGIGSAGQVLTVASGLPSWAAAAGGAEVGWELIGDHTVSGGAVSSITFSSLDGNTDEWYRFEIYLVATGALGGLDVRPNNDTTASNYRYQFVQASNTTVSAGRADYSNGMIVGNADVSGDRMMAHGLIYAKSGATRLQLAHNMKNINATTQDIVTWACVWKDTSANITSLVFDPTGAGSVIANGTRIKLWKGVAL